MHKFCSILILLSLLGRVHANDAESPLLLPADPGGLKLDSKATKPSILHDKKMSLHFQNIPLRALLQVIAEFSGKNIIVSDAVVEQVTLHLKDVPWREALEVILKLYGLEAREEGNLIWVDKSERLMAHEQLLNQSKIMRAQTNALDSELIQVNYAKAQDLAHLIQNKTNSILSKEGHISVDERTNMLWLEDTQEKMIQIKKMIQRLDVPVEQVLIEAKIVNINKNLSQEFGVRLGLKALQSTNVNQRNTVNSADSSGGDKPSLKEKLNIDLGALNGIKNQAQLGFSLATLGHNVELDLELSALENEGAAEVIANPRLMTTNQQVAMIASGEEIPYQASTLSGATAVSFKKALLSLKVVPQITPDKKLWMDIALNQDRPSTRDVNGVPAILTKEIKTNVLVKDGETLVLGGIYKKDIQQNITKVPLLGDIPGIGRFFSHQIQEVRNEELFIFITPKIVESGQKENVKSQKF